MPGIVFRNILYISIYLFNHISSIFEAVLILLWSLNCKVREKYDSERKGRLCNHQVRLSLEIEMNRDEKYLYFGLFRVVKPPLE